MAAPPENAITAARLARRQLPPWPVTRVPPATQPLLWSCDTRPGIVDLTDRSNYLPAPTVDSRFGSYPHRWRTTRKGETAVYWTRPNTLSAVRAIEAYAEDGVFARDGAKPLDRRIVEAQTFYVPRRPSILATKPNPPPIDLRTMTPATMFPYRSVPRVIADTLPLPFC